MDFFSTIEQMNGTLLLLFFLCLLAIVVFEFINGFHDTANAVATVIYTKSLKPLQAVLLSGTLNFLGVVMSSYLFGMAVAMSIIKLLPLGEMLNQSIYENVAIVGAVVLAAIIWNLGTWYFGIPCSSSHTLIGSMLGAGLGYQVIHNGAGVNWEKAYSIGMSLLLSPAFGFTFAIMLVFVVKRMMKYNKLFNEPSKKDRPSASVRLLLITTCSLVSFFHGSNDGQKGLGLLMIILMTFMPMQYTLNKSFGDEASIKHLSNIQALLERNKSVSPLGGEMDAISSTINDLKTEIEAKSDTTVAQKYSIRARLQSISKGLETLIATPEYFPNQKDKRLMEHEISSLKSYTDFAPFWAILVIAIAIGFGTMIGWKRIVVTIGERIGKSHLSYGQGAVSELVAASTIGISTMFGLPVSTTHVLSSAVAGSMVAVGGVKNLQKNTIKTIALAWILTLPVSIGLSFGLYLLFNIFT